MKKILLIALGAVALLLGSCTKDNGGGELGSAAVQSVSLNKSTTSILEGATETLSVVVAPVEAKNKAVSWSTNRAAVATVSAEGLVTAVKAGMATITVITKDGYKTAHCDVTVSKTVVAVEGVFLKKAATTILEGATEPLMAVVAPATATNQKVTWTSSDAAVATVSTAGLVTALKEGAATITVTTQDGNKTATCAVTVSKTVVAVEGVFLKTWATILEGATETLTAVVAPATATNQNVTWTSSDAAIATVSAAGLVTAVKAGTATITVTTQDGQKTADCVVTVSKMVVPVTGISLNKATISMVERATETLTAVVAPATATNQNVTWKAASNDGRIGVSEAGLVTAYQAGTATITVTTEDGKKTATCAVTVIPCYVEIDGVKWAKGNLVADGANGCKIGSATDYGLYFQFGSLVGWSGGATGDGTGVTDYWRDLVAVQVKPVGYVGTTAWTTVGRYLDGTRTDREYNYPATDDPSAGIGDPCRYYLGAHWRTPSAEIYSQLVGDMNAGVPLQVDGYELYFPGSCRRRPADGSLMGVGSGHYWSSSADRTDGYFLNFGTNIVSPWGTDNRLCGFPVRCVYLFNFGN